jgi:MoaA/NifB/PqqE/SkfB family radical SAM enzyme
MIEKNRERERYSFANINLLGKCNLDCYFCLGKDLEAEFSKYDQLRTPFPEWKNFSEYLRRLKQEEIKKVYITGQNCDSLQYRHLDALVDHLHREGFFVGIRTNGLLATRRMDLVNRLDSVGYTIHTRDPEVHHRIVGARHIPDWDAILSRTVPHHRVSIVVNRHNASEVLPLVAYLAPSRAAYVQLRRISTDTRFAQLRPDMELYEALYRHIKRSFPLLREFHKAEIFDVYGKETVLWRTIATSVNSMNYYTNGVINDEYFIIEGYLKHAPPEKT